MIREFDIAGRHLVCYGSPEAGSILYIHASVNDLAPVMERIGEHESAFVWVQNCSWERDFSPWPMRSIFRRGEDFTGGAADYLELLTHEIAPRCEEALSLAPKARGVAGYSLGGLFSLYASYLTDFFDGVCSVSGSLWYEGWLDYMASSRCRARYVRMSLGKGESKVKNSYFSRVEDCTKRALDILTGQGIDACLDMTEGTHRVLVHERIAAALKSFDRQLYTLL